MKIIYQSFDGKNFDTEKACRNYENDANRNGLNGILYGIFDWDTRERPTALIDKGAVTPSCTNDDIRHILSSCILVYLPTFITKKAFCEVCDNYGFVGDYDTLSTGWNVYNEDIDSYMPLTSIDSLPERWRDDSVFNQIIKWADDIYLRYGGGE